MKQISMLSLFSGIGSPEQALKNIGVDYELVGFSEIDKFAIKSYCNVHDVSEDLNLGDITNIDISSLPTDIDLITHGSPCQDFSIAGLQKGGDKGTGTRSSLMWATVDIVKHCRPKVVLWENVKNLLSKNHRHNFDGYLEIMEQLGYNNYYQVLNAKDYGIPQNRERVFTVSIRKDVDKGYTFPKQQELTLRLKDILEDQVNEKYYINKPWKYSTKDKHDVNEIAQIEGINYKAIRSITDVNKVCRCLDTMGGGQREPKILEPVKTDTGVSVLKDNEYRIRKLTPKECWRLMGFTDEQFDKAAEVCSNTQLYKQAGNSIVVNVLEAIIDNLKEIL